MLEFYFLEMFESVGVNGNECCDMNDISLFWVSLGVLECAYRICMLELMKTRICTKE